MKVFSRPAVEATVVSQQIVELLQRNIEAGHVEAVRKRRIHIPFVFVLHVRRGGVQQDLQQTHLVGSEAAEGCRFTRLAATISWRSAVFFHDVLLCEHRAATQQWYLWTTPGAGSVLSVP